MTLKLYCFGESGHSYKAALALELARLDWEPVFVDFFAGETRAAAYRETVNEMGEAPVLVDAGGLRLSQSGVIQQVVTELSGRFGGETPDEAREVLRWVLWDNHKLSSIAGMVRFQMNFLPEEKRDPAVIAFLQGRLQAALQILESHLAGRDWIVGRGPTNADLTCAGYLYYPEPFGFDRQAHPAIHDWLGRLSQLPGWKHPYDLMTPAHPEVRKIYQKEAVSK
ncbi:glutathione S-transferase family protein [Mangrovicoccus algicola]|uniref:Glutathione S-transferase family protein n=1 Tax=Mangrovicoccus algicola TaxID=2771008 RepID=A0A8J6YXA5_9RHOB|nr:glutathione S-transferase family protein [Mangrovicoccus algicola]MBE3639352.1 glutathione S-transferase family protein [Mangrovicoccus algicola]